jgi:hypothetical protein
MNLNPRGVPGTPSFFVLASDIRNSMTATMGQRLQTSPYLPGKRPADGDDGALYRDGGPSSAEIGPPIETTAHRLEKSACRRGRRAVVWKKRAVSADGGSPDGENGLSPRTTPDFPEATARQIWKTARRWRRRRVFPGRRAVGCGKRAVSASNGPSSTSASRWMEMTRGFLDTTVRCPQKTSCLLRTPRRPLPCRTATRRAAPDRAPRYDRKHDRPHLVTADAPKSEHLRR